ncbi:endocuticle structural glycoprotein SgAbd-2-like isoform X1 [Anthonomus grandis grandis]|uniref:endocuticle structural glycoprotein SgAbd-2-like isoform X1 n=2 Tax=Anthonomus grandis grandis TaxID=2921223 RepID=UPI002165F03D|nr:endocuticle structural glycoprotein SgAbd-2-like isoform X1 [Anthonomus grandis grandis]
MFLIMLACLLATTVAAPQTYRQQQQGYKSNQPAVPIVSESNEINPDGSFSYSYVSGDGTQAQAQGYIKKVGPKNTEAEVISGSYSYTAPDGTPITVNWIADENGFRAEGAHIPTLPPVEPRRPSVSRRPIGQRQLENQYSDDQYAQDDVGDDAETFQSKRRYRY